MRLVDTRNVSTCNILYSSKCLTRPRNCTITPNRDVDVHIFLVDAREYKTAPRIKCPKDSYGTKPLMCLSNGGPAWLVSDAMIGQWDSSQKQQQTPCMKPSSCCSRASQCQCKYQLVSVKCEGMHRYIVHGLRGSRSYNCLRSHDIIQSHSR